jgi:hypothetical protein
MVGSVAKKFRRKTLGLVFALKCVTWARKRRTSILIRAVQAVGFSIATSIDGDRFHTICTTELTFRVIDSIIIVGVVVVIVCVVVIVVGINFTVATLGHDAKDSTEG